MKSKFLATVSHELRTPMHAILGLLELELKRQPAPEGLPVVYSSASSLLNLLNDLQDHARLETGSLTLAPKPVELRPGSAHRRPLPAADRRTPVDAERAGRSGTAGGGDY